MKIHSILICWLALVACSFSAIRRIDVDVVFSGDNADGILGLDEVVTAGLPANTVAHVCGTSAINDGGEGYFYWSPPNWVRFEEKSNQSRIAFVYLSTGQSNNLGSGTRTIEQGIDTPRANFFQLSRGTTQSTYDAGNYLDIIPAYQPTQANTTTRPDNQVSLAFYFGNKVAEENPDWDVFLVHNAVGNTGFVNPANPADAGAWLPNGDLRRKGTQEVRYLVNRLKEAGYAKVVFGGHIFHQGERDAANGVAGQVAEYSGDLIEYIESTRDELSDLAPLEHPFVLGTMLASNIPTLSRGTEVDSVHRDIANLVPNATFADLSSLTNPEDGQHFGGDDLKTAGETLYLDAWKTLKTFSSGSQQEARPIVQVWAQGDELVATKNYTLDGTAPLIKDGTIYFQGNGALEFERALPFTGAYSKVAHFHNSNDGSNSFVADRDSALIGGSTINGGEGRNLFMRNNNRSWSSENNAGTNEFAHISNINNLGGTRWVTLALIYDGAERYYLTHDGIRIPIADTDDLGVNATNVSIGGHEGTKFARLAVKYAATFSGVITQEELQEINAQFLRQRSPINLTVNDELALYDFESDATDSTDNGNDGAGGSQPNYTGVATFAGAQHIELPINEDQVGTYQVRYRSSTKTGNVIVNGINSGGAPTLWLQFPTANSLQIRNLASTQLLSTQPDTNGVLPLFDNNWHNLAWSYNPETQFLAVALDGVIINSTAAVLTMTNNPVYIGRYGAGGTGFTGELDYVKLYNRALNFDELEFITSQ